MDTTFYKRLAIIRTIVIVVLALLLSALLIKLYNSYLLEGGNRSEVNAASWSQAQPLVIEFKPEVTFVPPQQAGPSQNDMPFYQGQLEVFYIEPDPMIDNRVAIRGLTPRGTFSVWVRPNTYENCDGRKGGPGGAADSTDFAMYSWSSVVDANGYPRAEVLCVTDDTTGASGKLYPPGFGK